MEQREDQKTRIKTILVICSMLLVLGGVCTPQISSFFGQKSAETIGAAGEQKRGIREQKDAKKQDPEEDAEKKDYIKWVDFNVCTEALREHTNMMWIHMEQNVI